MTESTPTPDGAQPRVHAIERVTDGVPEGAALLVLEGEFDLAVAGEFRRRVEELADRGADPIVLDLGAVGFMDSSMLKELLRASAQRQAAGARLVLVAPQPAIRRLLDLTGTTEMFGIAADREDALSG